MKETSATNPHGDLPNWPDRRVIRDMGVELFVDGKKPRPAPPNIEPLQFVRYEHNFNFDAPPPKDFLCPPMFNDVEEAMLAFLPISETPPRGSDDASFGRVNERTERLEVDRSAAVGALRQHELEEAIAWIKIIVADFFLRTSYVETFCHGDEELASWYLAQEFNVLLRSLTGDQSRSFRYRLSGGRELATIQMVAAASIMQADRAIQAYIDNRIDEFAYLYREVAFMSSQIVFLTTLEDARLRTRRRAFKAHDGEPKAVAMRQIREEFIRWHRGEIRYNNDAHFATRMTSKFPVIENEGSIKNNCAKWRREQKSSS